jgi:hypothetical protein
VLLSGCTGEDPGPPPPATTAPSTAPAPLEGLTGVQATGGIGVTALLPTTGPTLFDADRGPAATPPGYPGLGLEVRRVGTHAVFTAYSGDPGNKDPSEIFAYTGPSSPPRSLGRGWSVAPGADGESVWLIRQDAPDSCRLQHLSLTGGELGRGQYASCRTSVRAEIRQGLLITINAGAAESTDALIDPETGRTVRQYARILGATDDWLLLDGFTDLSLLDLRDGSRKPLTRPVAGGPPTVVPSREGGVFAIDFFDPSYRGPQQTRDIWLLRPDTQAWTHAPGMPFITEHLKSAGGFDWSDAGDLVLADGVLAAWHPGEPAWRLSKAALPAGQWNGIAVLP